MITMTTVRISTITVGLFVFLRYLENSHSLSALTHMLI